MRTVSQPSSLRTESHGNKTFQRNLITIKNDSSFGVFHSLYKGPSQLRFKFSWEAQGKWPSSLLSHFLVLGDRGAVSRPQARAEEPQGSFAPTWNRPTAPGSLRMRESIIRVLYLNFPHTEEPLKTHVKWECGVGAALKGDRGVCMKNRVYHSGRGCAKVV